MLDLNIIKLLGNTIVVSIYVIGLALLLNTVQNTEQNIESDVHPISPKTQAPQYQPIDRKKRKEKRVGD